MLTISITNSEIKKTVKHFETMYTDTKLTTRSSEVRVFPGMRKTLTTV